MTTAITFDILARENLSSEAKRAGDALDRLDTKVTRFGKNLVTSVGVGLGAAKLAEFAKSSVDAYTAQQAGQARLEDALRRFPKLADTNLAALRRLDDGIERRTGFLARDTEAGQANLAQFGLTGAQLKEVTPLLVDYADKTGQQIPEAATLLGRALLGNQRALKSIGIALPGVSASARDMAKAQHEVSAAADAETKAHERLKIMIAELSAKRVVTAADELRYTDAQKQYRDAAARSATATANLRAEQEKAATSGGYFDQIMTGLRGKVGGFADKEAQTAQGQVRKLRAEFDRVKVEIGAQLLPKLLDLGHFLNDTLIPDVAATAHWFQQNSDVIGPLAKVIVGLGIAVYGTNKVTAIWRDTSKAATTWTTLLGRAAGTAAIGVDAEATANARAATAQAEVATTARIATGAIEAEGAAAVATASELASAGVAATGLLAKLKSLPLYAVGLNSDQKTGRQYRLSDAMNKQITDAERQLAPSTRAAALKDFTNTVGVLEPGGPPIDRNKVIAWAKRWGLLPTSKDLSDLPAAGTANRVLQAAGAASAAEAKKTAKGVKDVLAGLPSFAVGSGTGIAAGIAKGIKAREQAALSAAKSLASKLKGEIGSLRSTLSQYESGIVGTITGNASILNTPNQTAAGIVRFERHQLSIDQSFHGNLAKLAKLGFSPLYISQLAQAGPEQAGNIAAQLTHASVAQRNELNRTARAIGVSAQQTGDLATKAYYGKTEKQLDALKAELVTVNKTINALKTDLATLARTGHLQTTVRR